MHAVSAEVASNCKASDLIKGFQRFLRVILSTFFSYSLFRSLFPHLHEYYERIEMTTRTHAAFQQTRKNATAASSPISCLQSSESEET